MAFTRKVPSVPESVALRGVVELERAQLPPRRLAHVARVEPVQANPLAVDEVEVTSPA